jgi:hypothetical protein
MAVDPADPSRGRRALLPAFVLIALAPWAAAPLAARADATKRVAVLDIELLKPDYYPSAHKPTADEQRRLDMVADLLRAGLSKDGYEVVARDATRGAIRDADPDQYLHQCNGCERDIAAALGADWVLVGWVQLVSNLIVNLNVVVYDVETGESVGKAFVDLRGNTDRSWRRATEYLLDNILLARLAARR